MWGKKVERAIIHWGYLVYLLLKIIAIPTFNHEIRDIKSEYNVNIRKVTAF